MTEDISPEMAHRLRKHFNIIEPPKKPNQLLYLEMMIRAMKAEKKVERLEDLRKMTITAFRESGPLSEKHLRQQINCILEELEFEDKL